MRLPSTFLLALASVFSFSFSTIALDISDVHKGDPQNTLRQAIEQTNLKVGSDSIYLSSLNSEYQPDQYLISDHLILVNDLSSMSDLLSQDITFTVAQYGHLELVDFDLKDLEAKIINTGSMSLIDCSFQEGKYLGDYISNQGAFSITNGEFHGSKEGMIIRDAVFAHGARLIL